MHRYRLDLQYVGTRFSGWQIQRNRRTVQGVLQEAVERVTGHRVPVFGAGRTDSGVHALGQVGHFCLPAPWSTPRLLKSLNGVLPEDVRVMRLRSVSADFHAQKSARRKRYEYRIYNGPVLSPFLNGLVYQVLPRLDWQAMGEAALHFEGTRDFSAFAASSSSVRHHVRTVFLSRVIRRGRHLTYRIEADGFLHHMVRNIVGTLLWIGRGRETPGDVERILESRDRRLAGPTASPWGLYLTRIWY